MAKSLVDSCIQLAWSQWGELGVSASSHLVAQHTIDLEAAICFLPMLAELEPRLFAEAIDWCVTFAGDFVSISVLKHTTRLFAPDFRHEILELGALLNSKSRSTKWPATPVTALPGIVTSGKSRCTVQRPACVQLRARKIFGIGARADILVALAQEKPSPEARWTHVNGLLGLGYTKRNLADALADLAAGGALGTLSFGNKVRYALRDPQTVRTLLAPMPEGTGRPWAHLLALAATIIRLRTHLENRSLTLQAVELRRTLESHRDVLARVGIAPPDITTSEPWSVVDAWLCPLLEP